MTSRERFRETMRYGRPDRPPYLEEGLREEVLESWRAQGLAEGCDPYELFPTDRRERVPIDVGALPDLDGRAALELDDAELADRLSPEAPGRFPEDWAARVARWRGREHILDLCIHHGFFLAHGVHNWPAFERAVYALADEPQRARGLMERHAELSCALLARVLDEVELDCVSFSEPIGGPNGPLLGPAQYRAFVLESYRPIVELVRQRSEATIVFVTYANARALLPSVVEAGFDCLWACEVNDEAMDYRAIRQEFGRDLRLIGGIDLDLLREDEATLRAALLERLPPLLAGGGYVPLADGRVRADVPWERYAAYRRLVRGISEGSVA